MSRRVKFESPEMTILLYSESIRMAPAFCLIRISDIFNGSHGGINSSGMPWLRFTRIASIAPRKHCDRFGSFLWHCFRIDAKIFVIWLIVSQFTLNLKNSRICCSLGMDCDDKENWIHSDMMVAKAKLRTIMSILMRFTLIGDQNATEHQIWTVDQCNVMVSIWLFVDFFEKIK